MTRSRPSPHSRPLVIAAVCTGVAMTLAGCVVSAGQHARTASAERPIASPSTAIASASLSASAAPVSASPGRQSRTRDVLPATPATTAPCSRLRLAPATARSENGVRSAVRALERQTGAHISLSWYVPSTGGVAHAGTLRHAAAWSTAKVPLALAVVDAHGPNALAAQRQAALRWSDNAAANKLWLSLGTTNSTRARRVTDALRRGGDRVTKVPSRRLYPPYSIFGQTDWSTDDQVRFLIALPCQAGAKLVIDDMAHVSTAQRWGIGTRPGATFKGGWGPRRAGGYAVRQLGWFDAGTGQGVIAVAVDLPRGGFERAKEILNEAQDIL